MKHILPIVTITTLAAAASAQSAAASSGLGYNNITASYVRTSVSGFTGHFTDYVVSAQALIGQSNFLVSGSSVVHGDFDTTGYDTASLGYLFRNVQGFADVILTVSSRDTYGIAVRKDLGNNLEATVSYARLNEDSANSYGIAVAYNFTKVYSLDLGWKYANYSDYGYHTNTLSAGLRYNF